MKAALLIATLGSAACATPLPCPQDPQRYAARSQELQEIVKADQADRSQAELAPGVVERDVARRKRVGEIFGEGCFRDAKDYAAAALVFQHGEIPDHFFQTFIWAKRAVELGDPAQKWLMAAGLDRYLVRIGHKQLFATQASILPDQKCWCLDPVEESVPRDFRMVYVTRDIPESLAWVRKLNSDRPGCPEEKPVCQVERKPSPRGTVPGFW